MSLANLITESLAQYENGCAFKGSIMKEILFKATHLIAAHH